MRSWLGDFDGGHSGCGGGLDAHVSVFEDEAGFGWDAETFGGQEEGLGVGFAAGVVAGADEGVKFVEDSEGVEGAGDRVAGASRDDGEGDLAVAVVDVLEDFGDGF